MSKKKSYEGAPGDFSGLTNEEIPLQELPPVAITPVVLSAPVEKPTEVSAAIFARISGIKVDKIAGFLAMAKRENLRPRSVAEWRELYRKYLTAPVSA